jgi:2'-deoxynucleoside 5'-phosphate N-hydrolase
MRVYLACTVRGDRSTFDAVQRIGTRVRGDGHHILTEHLLLADVEHFESGHSDQEIFTRDIDWLESADVLIAEASGSSYGVGFEVGYLLGCASRTGQRAFVFYRRDRHDRVSRLITGLAGPFVQVHAYDSLADLDALMDGILADLKP